MIRKILILLTLASLLLFACGSKQTGPNLKEGKWEITVKMEFSGKMPFQIPPQTFTQCITKDKAVPQQAEPNQNCKITKQQIKGDTVSWTGECKTPDGTIVTEGIVTYKGTTFEGTVKTKHREMDMIQNMTGKWIGECK